MQRSHHHDTPTASLDDLASLTTGADYWTSHSATTLGIRSVRMADGPHGLRVQNDESPDHLGLERSAPATCFPPAATIASSWDPELVREVGAALGREAKAAGVDVLLGPGLNIKRSPLCGRNFEYYSEDPLLSGVLAAAAVNGIQEAGVAACAKHFAVNNQETDRMRVSAQVDERALREIYLRTFEVMLRKSTPWAIMSAYNRINGVHASENHWLLTEVLRSEWGFEGVVISDWGAVHDPVTAINAGLDLRMPGRPSDTRVGEAIKTGAIHPDRLDEIARRMHRLAELTSLRPGSAAVDFDAHHELVRRAAVDSAVLLKNDGVLPLDVGRTPRIAVIGELARTPRYQGAGSSRVNAIRSVSGLDALSERVHALGGTVAFSDGYALPATHEPDDLVAAAFDTITGADAAVVFLGLPDAYESEGRDRTTIDLPADQIRLLAALDSVGVPLVIVLSNGAVVSSAAWKDSVQAILEVGLTGQAHGDAIADILLGAEPGGRLAETVPLRLSDTPAFLDFPGDESIVNYGEGVFVGYRYYDARSIDVDYPFGHGLSYTRFTYAALDVRVHSVDDPTALTVGLQISNTGERDGSDVIQVYVADDAAPVTAPRRELKGWAKVRLQAGETQTVSISIPRAELGHWSRSITSWTYGGGPATIHVGSSSRDLPLSVVVNLPGELLRAPLTEWSTLGDFMAHPRVGLKLDELVEARGGYRSRIGDLMTEEAGQINVRAIPLSTLVDLPGVPYDGNDVRDLLLLQ